MRLRGDGGCDNSGFHAHIIHQAKAQVGIIGERSEGIPVSDDDVARTERGIADGGELDAVDGPLDRSAPPGDDHIVPRKADRARTEGAGLLGVGGLLKGRGA